MDLTDKQYILEIQSRVPSLVPETVCGRIAGHSHPVLWARRLVRDHRADRLRIRLVWSFDASHSSKYECANMYNFKPAKDSSIGYADSLLLQNTSDTYRDYWPLSCKMEVVGTLVRFSGRASPLLHRPARHGAQPGKKLKHLACAISVDIKTQLRCQWWTQILPLGQFDLELWILYNLHIQPHNIWLKRMTFFQQELGGSDQKEKLCPALSGF